MKLLGIGDKGTSLKMHLTCSCIHTKRMN